MKEAAVVGIPHPKWDERPLACVVLKEGETATEEEILEHLKPLVAKWWLPDAVEFIDEVPKTSVGKFSKKDLRSRSSPSTPPSYRALERCRFVPRTQLDAPAAQRTKGGSPVSLTIGLPAASHSPMPPPTFTASKPFWLSHAATRAERPPPRQVT